MLVEYPPDKFPSIIPLFEKNKYLFILTKTILKEKLGTIFVDDIDNPTVASLSYRVFEVITGDASSEAALEILKEVSEERLLIFPNKEWEELANKHLILTAYPRAQFSSENLTIKHQEELLSNELPQGFVLEKIDIETAYNFNPKLAPAFLPFFDSPEAFVNRGIGYCIKKDELVVSAAAASLPIYDNEFEIQIITDDNPKYRRKGFATACSAALIKECLERNITPHIDTDNEVSTRLALKLGFTDPIHYNGYICSKKLIKNNEE